MNENKTAMYLVAIVGIVAAVGIVVLLIGVGLSYDLAGEVVAVEKGEKKTTKSWSEVKDDIKKAEIPSTVNTAEGEACECGLCNYGNGMGAVCCKKGDSSKCP